MKWVFFFFFFFLNFVSNFSGKFTSIRKSLRTTVPQQAEDGQQTNPKKYHWLWLYLVRIRDWTFCKRFSYQWNYLFMPLQFTPCLEEIEDKQLQKHVASNATKTFTKLRWQSIISN
jgi:hypothetical protein